MEKWENRYTVRKFVDTSSVSEEHIRHFKSMFEHLPTQQSFNDNIWLTLTSEHNDLKVWLLENIYHHTDKTGQIEYMVQVLSAPLVFISNIIQHEHHPEPSFHDANRNIGLHAGTLMEEALSFGYDVATIGCTKNYVDNLEDLHEKYQVKIKEYFGDKINEHIGTSEWELHPNLAVCIGEGEPLTGTVEHWEEYKGYRYAPFQKNPKAWAGVV